MNKTNYCIIMAGGIGARFWPLSRSNEPKQFLDILGTGRSFIRATFDRFATVVPRENFLVVTSAAYKDLVLAHLPEITEAQVLCEPLRRNTAPCIAYASYRIAAKCPGANIVVTPSDHLVLQESDFQDIIEEGLDFVTGTDRLLTIGIKPSRPETGYGYIQHEHTAMPEQEKIYSVRTFTEKPNAELANAFVDSGDFLWNSGIFIWSLSAIIKAFEQYLPQIASAFAAGKDVYGTSSEKEFIDKLYPQCENISIDYGIMEKAHMVYVRSGDFGWSDIGTWGSLYQNATKDEANNAITKGKVLTYNTQNSIINVDDNKIAVVEGLDGYLVVQRKDVLLITKLENEQNIRNFVDDIKYRFGEEYV